MLTMKLEDGGTATVVRLDGERIELDAPMAAAPGSRLRGSVAAGELKLKVHRSVRKSDGRFAITGVTFDLRREVREAVVLCLAEAPVPGAESGGEGRAQPRSGN